MWKFKDFAEGKSGAENAQIMKRNIERLSSIIPQVIDWEVGINEKTDCDFDAVLIMTFKNEEDLKIYINHPEHQLVSAYCKKVRTNRVSMDYFI